MKAKDLCQRYPATIAYSEEDACFIARIPAFRYCAGHGETPEEALGQAYEGLAGIIEVMRKDDVPLPNPDDTAIRLRQMKAVVKISKLARLAGMRSSTLASKIDRGGPFTAEERERIHSVLSIS